MGYRNNDACLDKVGDDEPIFVLRAQDNTAPMVVDFWADNIVTLYQVKGMPIPSDLQEKLDEARSHAEVMRQWPRRKLPGTEFSE